MKLLSSLTMKQKLIALALVVLVAGAMNSGRSGDNARSGFRQSAYHDRSVGGDTADLGYNRSYSDPSEGRDFQGNDQPDSDDNGRQPMQYGGGYGQAHGSGGNDTDVTSGYWDRQASQDRTNHAFGQYINDTTTVRDSEGTVYNDVSNDVASPAVESGSYSVVPTAELPVSEPAAAPAAEAPASE